MSLNFIEILPNFDLFLHFIHVFVYFKLLYFIFMFNLH